MASDTTDRDDPLAGIFGEVKTSSIQSAVKPKPADKLKPAAPDLITTPTPASDTLYPVGETIHAVGEAHGFVSREGKRDRRRGRRTKYTESRNFKLTPETYDRLDLLADALQWQMGKIIDEATQLLLKDAKKKSLIAND